MTIKNIKTIVGRGGLLLAALGILSSLLSLFSYHLQLFAWIDLWGDPVGWFIRTILIITGGALFIFYGLNEEL